VARKVNAARNAITVALAILTLFSAGSIAATTTRCAEWVGAVRHLQIGVRDVQMRTENGPQVLVAFSFKNGSPASVELEKFDVYLYVGSRFVGTNYVPFTRRRIDSYEATTIEIVVPISSPHQAFVEQVRQEEEDFSWFVHGRAKVLFPSFFRQETWLNVREHWAGE